MIFQYLILCIAILIGSIYWYYKKNFGFWDKHGFPHTEPSIPWGDCQGMMITEPIGEVISKIYKNNTDKPFVGFWMFFTPGLLVRDPELIKKVFVQDFMTFHDRGILVNERTDPLSATLFSISGSKWRNLRVKLTPTFTSGKMKMMFPIMTECSERFIEIMDGPAERGEVVDMKELAARFTTDIISLAAFGIDTDSLHHPDAEFRKFGRRIFRPTVFETLRNMSQALTPKLYKFFEVRTTPTEVSEFFLRAFRESMEYREKNNIRRNDFMDLLIQLKAKGRLEGVDNDETEGTKFTFEEAAAQAFVFFGAGFETSSTTMQFALYELAKNPDIQQKAREEIEQVLAKHNKEITYESILDMKYLGRVIDETLRMYPPVPFLQRVSNKEYKIPGTNLTIPNNCLIVIDCLGLQHDPKHFPNPEKFDPDRFTDEEKSKRHHYAYLPFGEGPRNCIGSRFGLMQTRVGLMTLIQNFKFSLSSQTKIPLAFDKKSFVLTPEEGMFLKVDKVA